MTKPSPEIEAVVRRWVEAHRDNESSPLINMLSTSERLRYMGTVPDEIWGRSLLRRGFAQHLSEVPDWTAPSPIIEGFEHLDVGWAIWRDAILFEGRDEVVDCRFSFALNPRRRALANNAGSRLHGPV